MKVLYSPKILNFNQTTQHHILDDSLFIVTAVENLKQNTIS
jgi:hypothetical protein